MERINPYLFALSINALFVAYVFSNGVVHDLFYLIIGIALVVYTAIFNLYFRAILFSFYVFLALSCLTVLLKESELAENLAQVALVCLISISASVFLNLLNSVKSE